MLPVNCNRMMTAGACPLTFWTVIIYKLKGYEVRGWPALGLQAILRTLSPPPTGVASKLSPITLQPKKEVPQWMILYTAKPLLSLPMLLSLDPFPYYSQCDICTLCYVDMCQCVYVCVCARVFFFYRMCFLLLAWRWALPHDWLAAPVMSWHAQCWN